MDSFTLVIFGITGNLAQIKLIPALYDLAVQGLLPQKITILGTSRKEMSVEELKNYIRQTIIDKKQGAINEDVFSSMITQFYHFAGNVDDPSFYPKLKEKLDKIAESNESCENRIFYLATYPELYPHIFEGLQQVELNKQDCGFTRIMIEKPIGNDLPSAQNLNKLLSHYFSEDQIYRLDHYLGKETLQNILTFRFGNGVFEHIINRDFIDHIQITAAEDFGIGQRGGFYDKVGALKDVGQNHLLQMLAFATMDAPIEFNNVAVTTERLKILKNLIALPEKVVFGQYEGYINEERVEADSLTETFFALKTEINNDRFRGVPIYIRAGKKLKMTVTEITLVFKNPDNRLFKDIKSGQEPNKLFYRIQPNEGIVLNFLAKRPGHSIELDSTYMQFCYKQDPHFQMIPDAYERLMMDTIRGDQTFFNDAEEIEAQWAFIDQLFINKPQTLIYTPGSWGPDEANRLIEEDGRSWIEPSPQFCSF